MIEAVAQKEKKDEAAKRREEILSSIPIRSTPQIRSIVKRRLGEFLSGERDYLVLKLNKSNATDLKDYINKKIPGVETSLYREGDYWAVRAKKTAATEAQTSRAQLTMPSYLAQTKGWENRYCNIEYAVFTELEKTLGHDAHFKSWFNSLSDLDKRGFMLYVRSGAISEYIGKKVEYKNEWDKNPALLGRLVKKYLSKHDQNDLMQEYGAGAARSKQQCAEFLAKNSWLQPYLKENFADFREGLFYFFVEHKKGAEKISKIASDFLSLKNRIDANASSIIAQKGTNLKTAPSANVSDTQIREIVASSFFGQAVYSVDSNSTLSIISKESNFDMKRGGHGLGVTQQTTRGGHFSLYSPFWKDRVNASSGAGIELQMVSIHVLNNNIFANVMEGVKTIAVKCAELGIKTASISSANIAKLAHRYNSNLKKLHPEDPEDKTTFADVYSREVASIYRKKTFAA